MRRRPGTYRVPVGFQWEMNAPEVLTLGNVIVLSCRPAVCPLLVCPRNAAWWHGEAVIAKQ